MADPTYRPVLDSLSATNGEGAATFVISADGREVIWANAAAGALLAGNVRDGLLDEALTRQFGRLPVPSTGFKLMRITFAGPHAATLVTCRAERIAVGSEDAALVVALDAPTPAAVPEAPEAPPVAAAPVGFALPIRLTWQSDAHGTITAMSEDWRTFLADGESLVGRSWADLAEAMALDPDGRLIDALERGETWSGVTLDWPLAEGLVLPVELAGLPVFDRARVFQGFRGFGVVREEPRAAEPDDLPLPEESTAAAEPERRTVAETDVTDGDAEDEASFFAAWRDEPPDLAAPDEGCAFGDAGPPVFADETDDAANTDGEPEADLEAEPEAEAAPEPEPEVIHLAPVLPFRAPARPNLKPSEHSAFQQIGRVLGAPQAADAPVPTPFPTATPPDRADEDDNSDEEVAPFGAAVDTGAAALGPATTGAAEVLEALPQAVLVHREGSALFANSALLALIGVADAAAIEAFNVENLFDARADERQRDGGVWLRTPDHRSIRVEAQLTTITWNGAPACLTAVTPIHDAVQETSDERELRAILDTATDGVVVLDGRSRILSVNRSGEALFGYDNAELVGRNFTLLLAAESHRSAVDYLDGIRANGVASVLNDGRDVVGIARRGGPIPLFMTLGRISEGDEERFCAVLRDLTQFRKTEEELRAAKTKAERASSQKSDFLARVSHEIRTPLNAVLGFAELMMEERFGPLGNDRYRDYLRDIHESGAHIISLINDLLDLSKVEAGKLELNFTGLNINEIVAGAVSLLQPQANSSRIIIRTSLAPRMPPVVGDARSLKQIALNLLSNAVKYTPAGGQVIVSTALTDLGQAVIRVRDTGLGMSDTEITTALEPFRQLSTTNAAGGTGLGLPLTKALVEANRATFAIQSAVGTGTLVEVIFPPTRVLAE
jgi:PAS domain S-box-containing protein